MAIIIDTKEAPKAPIIVIKHNVPKRRLRTKIVFGTKPIALIINVNDNNLIIKVRSGILKYCSILGAPTYKHRYNITLIPRLKLPIVEQSRFDINSSFIKLPPSPESTNTLASVKMMVKTPIVPKSLGDKSRANIILAIS